MKTIREVLAANIRRLRGERTQAEMAEKAGLPFRTYQGLEYGTIPRQETLDVLTRIFGVSELELFTDPDTQPTPTPTVEALLDVIRDQEKRIEEIKAKQSASWPHVEKALKEGHVTQLSDIRRRFLTAVSALDDEQLSDLLGTVETYASPLEVPKHTKKVR